MICPGPDRGLIKDLVLTVGDPPGPSPGPQHTAGLGGGGREEEGGKVNVLLLGNCCPITLGNVKEFSGSRVLLSLRFNGSCKNALLQRNNIV